MRYLCKSICIFALCCGSATADLTINTTMKSGTPAAPTSGPFGTGNIGDIVRAAADVWESLIQDSTTVNLEYQWLELGGTSVGRADLGESPPLISFDTTTTWFLDSTPTDHSEYGPMQTDMAGALSIGKHFTAVPGVASSSFDLFSVALHEIGHVLAGGAFTQPIVITSPRPSVGLTIQTTPDSHLNDTLYPQSLMGDSINFGRRRLVSDYDLLAVAQTGNFSSVSAVPEPSPVLYVSIAGVVVGCASIYRKRSRLMRREA